MSAFLLLEVQGHSCLFGRIYLTENTDEDVQKEDGEANDSTVCEHQVEVSRGLGRQAGCDEQGEAIIDGVGPKGFSVHHPLGVCEGAHRGDANDGGGSQAPRQLRDRQQLAHQHLAERDFQCPCPIHCDQKHMRIPVLVLQEEPEGQACSEQVRQVRPLEVAQDRLARSYSAAQLGELVEDVHEATGTDELSRDRGREPRARDRVIRTTCRDADVGPRAMGVRRGVDNSSHTLAQLPFGGVVENIHRVHRCYLPKLTQDQEDQTHDGDYELQQVQAVRTAPPHGKQTSTNHGGLKYVRIVCGHEGV
mmetsp:Transcript_125028/g.399762  ORF Transcript_125028/g.399762 Transcript_125028/m.399762 type:complete len:306 (+) Transcript_125028:676-1593(+)